MKRYIKAFQFPSSQSKASEEKPVLDSITTKWEEFEDGSGVAFSVYSEDGDVLYEQIFLYEDTDPDSIYISAVDMALLSLSQIYDLTEEAKRIIQGL